jgi:hypothetical protein
MQASMGLLNRAGALSYRAQSARKRGVLTMQHNSPFAILPLFSQSSQSRQHRDTSAVR